MKGDTVAKKEKKAEPASLPTPEEYTNILLNTACRYLEGIIRQLDLQIKLDLGMTKKRALRRELQAFDHAQTRARSAGDVAVE